VRYSFHGKVRATGQLVDGFVEASSSSEAIDRLADQGIIGVYTVRPESRSPKNAVILAGQEPHEEESHAEPVAHAASNAVGNGAGNGSQPPLTAATIDKAVANAATNPVVLQQLVEQIKVLSAQVEKLLARPAQVVYQSGGAVREGGAAKKRSARAMGADQSSTLRDIFQNNLDLRRSLEKLASTSGPTASAPANAAPVVAGSVTARIPDNNGRENSVREALRDIPKSVRETVGNGRDRSMQAQPAA
jgi:hypothetical protein